MKDDPIVAEVHAARELLAKRFHNDLREYGRHLQELERGLTNRVANFIPVALNRPIGSDGPIPSQPQTLPAA